MARKTKESKESVEDRLLDALEEVDRPGTFCTSGAVPAVLPGLEVEGLGLVGFPLTAGQAKDLKKRCEQAAYGKGEKTLVDTDVRRVWRLAPERFKLTNPAWAGVLDEVLAKVQKDLGLEGQKLQAHLYDLLLYEKGSFFLPHRDSEKLHRMVASLIVVLPSAYTGGELVVRHEGEEQVIDFAGGAGEAVRFQGHYAAFYADCEHEVKPLQSGYRLCLVYNLTLAKSKKPVGAPRRREHVEKVAGVLREWSGAGGPEKLAVTLEHQYTQDGLAWDTLKGVDAARARVLAEAAREADCHVYLALLTLYESGSCEGGYDDYYSSRRRRRYYDEDEDDEGDGDDDEGGGKYTMGELFDSSLTADHLRSPDGKPAALASVPVEESEVLPEGSLKSVKPEEQYEGYTGNAGMTLDRWYRHAVVLLWPDRYHFDVLCAGGAKQAVPALARMVSSWKRAKGGQAAALKERCRAFAETILSRWPEVQYRGWRPEKSDAADASDPMPSLAEAGRPEAHPHLPARRAR